MFYLVLTTRITGGGFWMVSERYERRTSNQHGGSNLLTRREVNSLVGCYERILTIANRDGMFTLVKTNLLVALTKLSDAVEISERKFKRT